MQAIILAAGMGKRLKELTADNTKCMVPVNGVRLIERMLNQLDSVKLSRIILVIGYEGAQLRAFVESLPISTHIEFVENPIYDTTNNIYSLYLARHYMSLEDTLLLESDLIFEDRVLTHLIQDPYPSLALVAKYESWMDGTVVTLNSDNSINEFLDKRHFKFSDIDSYYKTVNIYKFGKAFSSKYYIPFLEAYCKALGTNEYYEQVLKVIALLDDSEIKALPLEEGDWYEIDDIQDLDIAESIFAVSPGDKLSKIARRYGGYWRYPHMLDYCYLVNPYYPTRTLLDEMKAKFDDLTREYPSGQDVNALLAAKYFGIDVAEVVVGNGAAELIKSIVALIPGRLGLVVPTFEEYHNRKGDNVEPFYASAPDYRYTADDLIQFFSDKNIQVLVLVNPDNPTGNYIGREDILRLAKWCQDRECKLILDESFVDFADIQDSLLESGILKRFPNLFVIKSISKSFGVPGYRLGIVAGSDLELIGKVKRDVSIWNINSFGEFFLQIFEKYKLDYADSVRHLKETRTELVGRLEQIEGLRVLPTHANFVMCGLPEGVYATDVAQTLLDQYNILIKDLSGKRGIDGQYIRLGIRSGPENEKLVQALAAVLNR